MKRVRIPPKPVLKLIIPSFTETLRCLDCDASIEVVVWNGVSDFEMSPPQALMDECDTVKVDYHFTFTPADFFKFITHHRGSPKLILWVKDDGLFELSKILFKRRHEMTDLDDKVKH